MTFLTWPTETVGESDVHSMSLRKDMVSKPYVIWNANRNNISHSRYLTLKEITSQEVIMLRISKRLIWYVQLSHWGIQGLISVYRPLYRINLSLKGIVHPKFQQKILTRIYSPSCSKPMWLWNLKNYILKKGGKWGYIKK